MAEHKEKISNRIRAEDASRDPFRVSIAETLEAAASCNALIRALVAARVHEQLGSDCAQTVAEQKPAERIGHAIRAEDAGRDPFRVSTAETLEAAASCNALIRALAHAGSKRLAKYAEEASDTEAPGIAP
jgi:hypothetical protein